VANRDYITLRKRLENMTESAKMPLCRQRHSLTSNIVWITSPQKMYDINKKDLEQKHGKTSTQKRLRKEPSDVEP